MAVRLAAYARSSATAARASSGVTSGRARPAACRSRRRGPSRPSRRFIGSPYVVGAVHSDGRAVDTSTAGPRPREGRVPAIAACEAGVRQARQVKMLTPPGPTRNATMIRTMPSST